MPLPPSPQCVHRKALVPTLSAAFITSAISLSVSVMNRLMATTGGTPNLRTFSRCRLRLSQPLATAAAILVLEVVLGDAAVHLERAHGGDDDGGCGIEAGLAALDVEELLRAEVGAEAGLRHHVVAQLERGLGGEHRVAAVRDVGERAAVDEDGVVLQRLHQVRHQRVLEQHGHGAVALEVGGLDRLPVARVADDDVAEPALEVLEVHGEAEDRHHLGGDRDVEAVLAREAVGGAAQRVDDSSAARGRSCPARGARRCGGRRSPARCPSRCELSSSADSRLCAEVMAWKSPVKWRLMSSIGTTWA